MTTPTMSSITASLERSLQSFSLNQHHPSYSSSGSNTNGSGGSGGIGIGSGGGGGDGGASFQENQQETSYELNSHISLPYHWEQCIDIKTGELYYINWRTGMKAKEDPRTSAAGWNDDFDEYSEDDDDDSSYDSEDSSTEESPPPFSRNQSINNYNNQSNERGNNVLVVGGCKSCMMYFMVPKQVEDCPKCNGQLLHFDKSENNASSP